MGGCHDELLEEVGICSCCGEVKTRSAIEQKKMKLRQKLEQQRLETENKKRQERKQAQKRKQKARRRKKQKETAFVDAEVAHFESVLSSVQPKREISLGEDVKRNILSKLCQF